MSKKKKWWQRGWTPIEQKKIDEFNQETVGKGNGVKRKMDDQGFYIDEGDDYGYGGYGGYQSTFDWGLDRKLMNTGSTDDQAARSAGRREEFNHDYGSGAWRGYESYRAPQLSYKYVQQMANALAAQHRITVRVGTEWKVDLIKRELTYNPGSLIYGTKSELLATLMHEIGKLRYCEHSTKLKNKYLEMYKMAAREVLSTFEDVRVDYMMLKAYESATEIYESSIPAIERQVKMYVDNGKRFRDTWIEVVKMSYSKIVDPYIAKNDMGSQELSDKLLMTFGCSKPEDVEKKLMDMASHVRSNGSIYEYCGEIIQLMYDLDSSIVPVFKNIKEKAELTYPAIEPSKKKESSQELVNFLDTDVYPHVEDLMKDFSEKSETLEKFFPKMTPEMKKEISELLNSLIENHKGGSVDKKGNVKTRSSGQTSSRVPPEWEKGDYKVLKDSVTSEIKELINKLTFIRREELIIKYQADQKRGKLNTRKLYKSAVGSRRLFKHKLSSVDTVQSFAFSVLLDISGSMNGSRAVHSTRALIIFAEVFKRVGIPFEIVVFGDTAKTIKSFEQEIDKDMEKSIGGLVRADGGGTNLDQGLNALKIGSRPEANKIVIVLSDGGVGDINRYNHEFFEPMLKKGIKSTGFGIECEAQMAQLCLGNSRVLTDASMLPVEFTNLVKSLIKRKN